MIVSLARVMDQCGWKVTFVIQQRYQLKRTVLHRMISASGRDWETTTVSSHQVIIQHWALRIRQNMKMFGIDTLLSHHRTQDRTGTYINIFNRI